MEQPTAKHFVPFAAEEAQPRRRSIALPAPRGGPASEITIELTIANSLFSLTRRDADIAVRPAVTVRENLMGRRLAALATAPYASPAYLAHSSAKWIEATVPVIASSTVPTRCEPCRPRRGAAWGLPRYPAISATRTRSLPSSAS